jgi:AcrR family transcriptional regulator
MTITTIDRPTRWRRRKLARPGEILGAALACFAERGFAATRLDDVARRAGVTKGTLYLYFANKEELFQAVVRQALVPNIERGEALLDAADEPAAHSRRSSSPKPVIFPIWRAFIAKRSWTAALRSYDAFWRSASRAASFAMSISIAPCTAS